MVDEAEKHLDVVRRIERLEQSLNDHLFSEEHLEPRKDVAHLMRLIVEQRQMTIHRRITERLISLSYSDSGVLMGDNVLKAIGILNTQHRWFTWAFNEKPDDPSGAFTKWLGDLALDLKPLEVVLGRLTFDEDTLPQQTDSQSTG